MEFAERPTFISDSLEFEEFVVQPICKTLQPEERHQENYTFT